MAERTEVRLVSGHETDPPQARFATCGCEFDVRAVDCIAELWVPCNLHVAAKDLIQAAEALVKWAEKWMGVEREGGRIEIATDIEESAELAPIVEAGRAAINKARNGEEG